MLQPRMGSGTILLISVHLGPYLSLAPLEREFPADTVLYVVEGPSREACRSVGREHWDWQRISEASENLGQFLLDQKVRAIIVGTSDVLHQRNIEEDSMKAACRRGIPVFAIEDFPGNYRHQSGYRLDGLFVEDELLRPVHMSRGVDAERIHCLGNPRYDALRSVDRNVFRAKVRAHLGIGDERVVLWAGQPDEAHSYQALERIVPDLPQGIVLLFKAHPRDRLYREGVYGRLLSGIASVRDVTSDTDTIGLCCAADLVITQFSSVAVEAGYLGTPALYVLFDDLGRAYLQRQKGYDLVPWVVRGCAFLLDSTSPAARTIETALFDEGAREKVARNFGECYGSRPVSARAIATLIHTTVHETV